MKIPRSIVLVALPETQNTLAIHFRAGEVFQLTGFHYANVYGGMNKYVVFDESPALALDRPGIYFYGNIVSRNDKAALVEDYDDAIVQTARAKYPKVFAALDPVNFEPTSTAASWP